MDQFVFLANAISILNGLGLLPVFTLFGVLKIAELLYRRFGAGGSAAGGHVVASGGRGGRRSSSGVRQSRDKKTAMIKAANGGMTVWRAKSTLALAHRDNAFLADKKIGSSRSSMTSMAVSMGGVVRPEDFKVGQDSPLFRGSKPVSYWDKNKSSNDTFAYQKAVAARERKNIAARAYLAVENSRAVTWAAKNAAKTKMRGLMRFIENK